MPSNVTIYTGPHPHGDIRPCPFCGTEMNSHTYCFSHPKPERGGCLLKGYSFANEHVRQWNNRQLANLESVFADKFRG
jgi:hypothetical protein